MAAAAALGAALAIRPIAALSALYASLTAVGAAVLLIMFLNVLQIGFSRPSPGGNDNGSGLLVLLEIARRLAGKPLRRTRVFLLATGAEEAGFFGIRAFLKAHPEFDLRTTLFINVDSIGGGHLHWAADEGCFQRIRTPRASLELLDRLEARQEIPALPRSSILSPTDATILGRKGFRFLTLIGLNNNSAPPSYHRIADTFDKLDRALLEAAADIIAAIARSGEA
jgi:Zn-dependent M28 family amino/carboxypeptidase